MGGEGDEKDQIRLAVGGDRVAAHALVVRLMPIVQARVRILVRSQRGHSDLSDDLVQEVWTRLLSGGARMLLTYDPSRGASLEAYVGMLATREASNILRGQRAKRRGGHLSSTATEPDHLRSQTATPAEVVSAAEVERKVLEFVETELPLKGRLVFRYIFTDRLSPSDTARTMGVKLQVVYNWQHRIRSGVMKILATAARDTFSPALPELRWPWWHDHRLALGRRRVRRERFRWRPSLTMRCAI